MYFSVSPTEWGDLGAEIASSLPLYTQSLLWCLAHNRQPINIWWMKEMISILGRMQQAWCSGKKVVAKSLCEPIWGQPRSAFESGVLCSVDEYLKRWKSHWVGQKRERDIFCFLWIFFRPVFAWKTESLGPTGAQLLGREPSEVGLGRVRLFVAEGSMLLQRFENTLPTLP